MAMKLERLGTWCQPERNMPANPSSRGYSHFNVDAVGKRRVKCPAIEECFLMFLAGLPSYPRPLVQRACDHLDDFYDKKDGCHS